MIVDIENELYTVLKDSLVDVTVEKEYNSKSVVFPCITISEISNNIYENTVDTSGETHNIQAFEINIFTAGSTKVTTAKSLRKQVDTIMGDTYKMSRDFSSATPNYIDDDIYRYTMRYSCIVSKNKKIYRGY